MNNSWNMTVISSWAQQLSATSSGDASHDLPDWGTCVPLSSRVSYTVDLCVCRKAGDIYRTRYGEIDALRSHERVWPANHLLRQQHTQRCRQIGAQYQAPYLFDAAVNSLWLPWHAANALHSVVDFSGPVVIFYRKRQHLVSVRSAAVQRVKVSLCSLCGHYCDGMKDKFSLPEIAYDISLHTSAQFFRCIQSRQNYQQKNKSKTKSFSSKTFKNNEVIDAVAVPLNHTTEH